MLDYFDIDTARVHDTSFATRSLTEVKGLTGVTGARGVVFDRPDADGSTEPDEQFMPARMVILGGETWGATIDEMWDDWDVLSAAFEAILREPKLCKWRRAGGSRDLQFTGRLAGEVEPVLSSDENGPFLRWQAIIRAADPAHYSQTVDSQSVASPTSGGGMPLPVEFPLVFSSASSGGQITATNEGKRHTWPTITIDGPITNPVVENVTTGKLLSFTSGAGLVLADGQSLVIETRPGAPRSATVAGVSAVGALDFTVSEWWPLEPGANDVRFSGAAGIYGANTLLTVAWRDAWIS